MLDKLRTASIVLAEDNTHARRLLMDVLRAEGFTNVVPVGVAPELLGQLASFPPRVVIISEEFEGLSASSFTKLVRAGYRDINRSLSIIATSRSMTPAMLETLRKAGVDEALAQPFSSGALLLRLEAVVLRPRRFIDSANYRGPCRRRKMLEEYGGPLRRLSDPDDAQEPWEAESNRALARLCVEKIANLTKGLTDIDRRKMREIYAATQDTEQLADDIQDVSLGDASRSLNRYIMGIGATGQVDPEVVRTHLDAMQTLSMLGAHHAKEREQIANGLKAIVDKRLANLV